MSRLNILRRITTLCGEDVLRVTDPRRGWPALAELATPDGLRRIAFHVSAVTLSHRGRDEVERRIQNPGKGRAEEEPAGAYPLILGLWEEEDTPVLVGWDAERRIGKATRHSMFIPLRLLRRAAETGWATDQSASEETLIAFIPPLLPTYVEARAADEPLSDDLVGPVLEASGLTAAADQPAAERARSATTRLVRNAKFGREVVDAYGGRCALCGIGMGIVEGAHIYPVQAGDSPDMVPNGLALCSNHHRAFDLHLIWVDPHTRDVRLHPSVLESQSESKAQQQFIEITTEALRGTPDPRHRPSAEMFRRRYSFFQERYEWAQQSRKLGL
jgi:hypothetical protein